MNKSQKLFDVRAIERNLKHRTITHKEVTELLANLPDVSAKLITLGELDDRRVPPAPKAAEPEAVQAAPLDEEPAPAPTATEYSDTPDRWSATEQSNTESAIADAPADPPPSSSDY